MSKLTFSVSLGIQMRRKELTKTFMMISNWSPNLVSMVHAHIFQVCEGLRILSIKKQILMNSKLRARFIYF